MLQPQTEKKVSNFLNSDWEPTRCIFTSDDKQNRKKRELEEKEKEYLM